MKNQITWWHLVSVLGIAAVSGTFGLMVYLHSSFSSQAHAHQNMIKESTYTRDLQNIYKSINTNNKLIRDSLSR